MSRQVVNINNLKRLRRLVQVSSTGHLTYCAARLLPALSRLTPAYCTACLLCRLIFDLPIDSLLTRYASVTEPALRARFRAVGSAPRPSDSLMSPYAQLRASSVTCASACRSTAFLRQAGRPARSITSATPCAPPNTNRCAAFVCPFRVPARTSLPTRIVHTKAAPSHRAGHRRGTLRARCAVCSSERTSFSVPPNGGPVHADRSPPTAISPCAPQYETGVRCSIRPVRGSFLADLAPGGFNTAPVQRAGYRRSMNYALIR